MQLLIIRPQALFEHVKDKPDMSVDDMLWWLYDTYKIVVGTRTIRRVFERKGDKVKPGKGKAMRRKSPSDDDDDDDDDENEKDLMLEDSTPVQADPQPAPETPPAASRARSPRASTSPYPARSPRRRPPCVGQSRCRP